jgi:hypothetical protein
MYKAACVYACVGVLCTLQTRVQVVCIGVAYCETCML